ncbi:24197_t:CDS:2, partial [Gigaspora rosea]
GHGSSGHGSSGHGSSGHGSSGHVSSGHGSSGHGSSGHGSSGHGSSGHGSDGSGASGVSGGFSSHGHGWSQSGWEEHKTVNGKEVVNKHGWSKHGWNKHGNQFRSTEWFNFWWNKYQSQDVTWWTNFFTKYAAEDHCDDGLDLDATHFHSQEWWAKWWKQYGYKKHFDTQDCDSTGFVYKKSSSKSSSSVSIKETVSGADWFDKWWSTCESKDTDWWYNFYKKYALVDEDGKDLDSKYQHTKEWWSTWWKSNGYKKQFDEQDCTDFDIKFEGEFKTSSFFEAWWSKYQSQESSWWETFWQTYASKSDDGKDLDSKYHHTKEWWQKWWSEYGWKETFETSECDEFKSLVISKSESSHSASHSESSKSANEGRHSSIIDQK